MHALKPVLTACAAAVLMTLVGCQSSPLRDAEHVVQKPPVAEDVHEGVVASAGCPDGAVEGADQGYGHCGDPGCTACAHKYGKKGRHDWEQIFPDHCWPEQYVREDARRVNFPFCQQMINGLRVETTVWEHYFESASDRNAELNEAGRQRLLYFTRKRPFVVTELALETSFDAELDAKRIETVVEFLSEHSTEPYNWQVTVVNRQPVGLFGREAGYQIDRMVGETSGGEEPPIPTYYEQIYQLFNAIDTGGGGGG